MFLTKPIQLKKEQYHELADILKEQQQFHANLASYDSERFLKIGINEFCDYMSVCPHNIVIVIRHGHEIVAFIAGNISKDGEGCIEDLYVKPEYRNRHLGHRLMTEIKKWFASHNTRYIQVHVTKNNENALTFYEKYDFNMTGYTLQSGHQ